MAKLPKHLGIDFGSRVIKIVLIENNKLTILKTLELPNPGMNNYAAPLVEETTKLLTDTISQLSPPTNYAAFSIPQSSVFNQLITLPLVSPDELPEAVYWQLQKTIPQDLSTFIKDFTVVHIDKEKEALHVLAVAVPIHVVDSYKKIIEKAQLVPVAAEPDMFASTRVVLYNNDIDNCTIIEIGANTTTVGVVLNKQLAITQNISFGSEVITQVIQSVLNVSRSQAQEYKAQYGISNNIPDQEVKDLLKPVLNQFITELLRILDFIRKSTSLSIDLQHIFLTGGGAKTQGLAEYIKEMLELKTPAKIVNPFQKLSLPPPIAHLKDTPHPEFAVSVGLALKHE